MMRLLQQLLFLLGVGGVSVTTTAFLLPSNVNQRNNRILRASKVDDTYYSSSQIPLPSRQELAASAATTSTEPPLTVSSTSEETAGEKKEKYGSAGTQRITLPRYLSGVVQDNPELRDMESLLLSVQMACKTISNLVHRAGINHLSSPITTSLSPQDQYDIRLNSMKKLDQLSTTVLQHALHFTGKLQMVTPAKSQRQRDKKVPKNKKKEDDQPDSHQPGVLIAKAYEGRYVACFDPLDGSGNADAAICTGTVFGIFETDEDDEKKKDNDDKNDDDDMKTREELVQAVLQPGKNLRAAGYCLYSSATILVLSLGDGKTHGFTLDPQINEFVLTHWNMRIPSRGNVYSCNEANSEGWSDKGWKEYLKKIKRGQGETGEKYALRYVGSMVGDIHRTLMYGGIFGYPSDTDQHPNGNLQLLYKCAPMGYIVSQAGGLCTNGEQNLLDIRPSRVHERSPVFMGSPEDMKEMMEYVKHTNYVDEEEEEK